MIRTKHILYANDSYNPRGLKKQYCFIVASHIQRSPGITLNTNFGFCYPVVIFEKITYL